MVSYTIAVLLNSNMHSVCCKIGQISAFVHLKLDLLLRNRPASREPISLHESVTWPAIIQLLAALLRKF